MDREYFEGRTAIAAAPVEAHRYVVHDSAGKVAHVGTAGTIPPTGVSMEKQEIAGRSLPIWMPKGGLVKIEAGAAIRRGAKLMSDASGKAIPYVEAVNNVCTGMAEEEAWTAGKVISASFFIMKTGGGT